jgi:probable HAF family extracellular repeat protein
LVASFFGRAQAPYSQRRVSFDPASGLYLYRETQRASGLVHQALNPDQQLAANSERTRWTCCTGHKEGGMNKRTALFGLFTLGMFSGPVEAISFDVTVVAPPQSGGFGFMGAGINSSGGIVGNHRTFFDTRVFVWDPVNGRQEVQSLRGRTATGISDHGEISVSGFIESAAQPHALLWSPIDGLHDLGALSDGRSAASGISPSGQFVVGYSDYPTGANTGDPFFDYVPRAFIWDEVNGMQVVEPPTDVHLISEARGVNDSGQIVGHIGRASSTAKGPAALWDPIEGLIPLVPNGFAVDINEAGQIIGHYFTSLQLPLPSHAFFYDDGQFVDLGSLGRTHASASDINAEGQAVGWAYSGGGGFFDVGQLGWYYDGQSMRNLNRLIDPALGWHIMSADGINDAGQIVATARPTSLEGHWWLNIATLLLDPVEGPAPVPEPRSLWLLGLGLAGLGLFRRSRC